MKRVALLLVAALIAAMPAPAFSAEGRGLVAYFSWGGNTETVAKTIVEAAGFELFKITTAEPYTDDYDKVLDVAKAEQNRNARPELATHVQDMGQYDTIFLGYPCWWGTLPMPVFTFLEEYDFSGKRVIPFVTHGGSSFGRSLNDLKRLAPNAVIEQKGLSLYGTSASDSRDRIIAWLEGLGFAVKK